MGEIIYFQDTSPLRGWLRRSILKEFYLTKIDTFENHVLLDFAFTYTGIISWER